MSGSSTLDPDNFPAGGGARRTVPPGHDTSSLGPSDSSDSGSDLAGSGVTDEDELARGTNEDSEADTDRVVDASEAGLGGGLDQAEEAQLGKTDEQIERENPTRPSLG